jgi:hypothetical protein
VVADVTFNSVRGKLTIRGSDLKGQVQFEVNGVLVPASVVLKPNRAGTRLKVKAEAGELGLVSGPNRVRLLKDGLRSNIFVLTL